MNSYLKFQTRLLIHGYRLTGNDGLKLTGANFKTNGETTHIFFLGSFLTGANSKKKKYVPINGVPHFLTISWSKEANRKSQKLFLCVPIRG